MNKILLILVTIFLANSATADFKLIFSHSEAMNYLIFLDTGFKEPNISGSLCDFIAQQKNNPFSDKNRKHFEGFKGDLKNGFNFQSIIPNRPDGFWAEDGLKILAANSNSLESFEQQLSMFLSYQAINHYFDLKAKVYPFFKENFWNKTLPLIKKEEAKIQKEIERIRFTDLLQKAKRFYKSVYPESIPFKISLISIPDKNISNKHSSAENLKDIQVVSYLQSRGAISNLDVVFHEFSHALYRAQSMRTKKMIDNFYLQSRDSHSLFVYRFLNEALATALGNGWFREKQDGRYYDKPWYSVTYINKLAKAYYPLVKRYLAQGRSIDRVFLKETLRIAKKIFPSVNREIAPNFMAVNMYVDHDAYFKDFRAVLKKSVRIQSFASYNNIEQEHLDGFESKNLKTSIFISSNDLKLKKIFNIDQSLRNQNVLVIFPKNGQYRFWFKVDSIKNFKALMNKLLALKKLPEAKSIIKL